MAGEGIDYLIEYFKEAVPEQYAEVAHMLMDARNYQMRAGQIKKDRLDVQEAIRYVFVKEGVEVNG